MKKNTLDDYKQAIQAKYEEDKSGDYSSFLINPSRAKLRDLCTIHYKENGNPVDFAIFRNFFGFEFEEDNSKELKKQTDKFRPLETFFKGETDLTDISAVDLAAVLVNYNPRPLNRFIKVNGIKTEASIEENTSYTIVDKSTDFTTEEKKKEPIISHDHPSKRTVALQSTLAQIQHKTISVKQMFKILILFVIILVSAYGMKELIVPEKQCMQWQNDHYEIVDCSSTTQGIGAINEIKPIIEEELKLKKIEVSLQTPFFQKNKAAVWYCKKDNKIEYFNEAGYHPENGKPLKPISQYIITKYIKE
ncbi:hypothetical protein [Flavobacterium degerlachei]|jgi:hypothetical protein|uniref:Uncharacterized protein n=1 Tax=Flavobacterium degerlachei TaxID=229203 RepID=A0A1H3F7N1_9FLAO|nr:hypothetical protein [Flavobacterium degerlachei]SDX86940.1 hypothetical protein SAMN05444338_1177 [Flavobacterium degerlachei]